MSAVKLSLKERFKLIEIIPQEGDITTIKTIRVLREELSPTEEEQEKFDMKVSQNESGSIVVTWDEKKELDEFGLGSFDFTNKEISVISTALSKLNESKKLTEDYIDLYDKFIDS